VPAVIPRAAGEGTVGVGVLVGVALIIAGMVFGTRTFQRESQ
jgi:hypothetical protein